MDFVLECFVGAHELSDLLDWEFNQHTRDLRRSLRSDQLYDEIVDGLANLLPQIRITLIHRWQVLLRHNRVPLSFTHRMQHHRTRLHDHLRLDMGQQLLWMWLRVRHAWVVSTAVLLVLVLHGGVVCLAATATSLMIPYISSLIANPNMMVTTSTVVLVVMPVVMVVVVMMVCSLAVRIPDISLIGMIGIRWLLSLLILLNDSKQGLEHLGKMRLRSQIIPLESTVPLRLILFPIGLVFCFFEL